MCEKVVEYTSCKYVENHLVDNTLYKLVDIILNNRKVNCAVTGIGHDGERFLAIRCIWCDE